MSREDDDDDARLFSCFKKYEEIVKQVLLFDEMTESMDPSPRSSKRKTKQNCRGNNSKGAGGTNGSVLDRQSFDEVIVQTITKFLHDLNATTIDHSNPEPPSDE
ncbi:uncharacterized protein LOC112536479 [Ricinus communis]|uniref:Uncharacterized protein n=1 Tax=Ricinus communis TaxID=3988 RepID=B9SVC6_RICCO|nr:uncharacterized protein LOC112536479 [Ricinus communis]EEF32453.1 conserved hypothetical protein [Ricinus communis]|eukprot:XP_025015005.1 uncharacterized protein LOC112536479 [Ricinus communis]